MALSGIFSFSLGPIWSRIGENSDEHQKNDILSHLWTTTRCSLLWSGIGVKNIMPKSWKYSDSDHLVAWGKPPHVETETIQSSKPSRVHIVLIGMRHDETYYLVSLAEQFTWIVPVYRDHTPTPTSHMIHYRLPKASQTNFLSLLFCITGDDVLSVRHSPVLVVPPNIQSVLRRVSANYLQPPIRTWRVLRSIGHIWRWVSLRIINSICSVPSQYFY